MSFLRIAIAIDFQLGALLAAEIFAGTSSGIPLL